MSNTDTIKFLKEARALITNPKNWTSGSYARNAKGEGTDPDSSEAVCWCGAGAIFKVTDGYASIGPNRNAPKAWAAFASFNDFTKTTIPNINDALGHDAILKAFDNTIEYLESQI